MTEHPYVRAAKKFPKLKQQAVERVNKRNTEKDKDNKPDKVSKPNRDKMK